MTAIDSLSDYILPSPHIYDLLSFIFGICSLPSLSHIPPWYASLNSSHWLYFSYIYNCCSMLIAPYLFVLHSHFPCSCSVSYHSYSIVFSKMVRFSLIMVMMKRHKPMMVSNYISFIQSFHKSNFIVAELQNMFPIKDWPVFQSAAKEGLQKIVHMHQVFPVPACDLQGHLIPPIQYCNWLEGAVV